MAENNERSRADDLFEILNEFNDDNENKTTEPAAAETPKDESSLPPSHVDEILEILSRGREPEENRDTADEAASDGDIPISIFSHLSEEGESSANTSAAQSESSPHFSSHFSEDDSIPEEEPIAEEEAEVQDDDENGDEDDEGKVGIVKKIFRTLSVIPKAVVYVALVLIVSAYLSYYIITIANDVFAFVSDNREINVTIEDGATHDSVAELLKENGVIEYGWVYKLYMNYRSDGDSSNEYIPGEYKLNTNYNYSQIITVLTANNVKREIVRVTIPEGFTIDQTIDLLVEKGVGTREGYIEAINNYPYKWEFVKLLEEKGYSEHRKYRLEGYLYPDTYDFYTTESEVYVVNKMLNAFNDKFWKDFTRKNMKGESYQAMMLDNYGMDFDDIIILASMVQSEGGTVDDFYAISYVFHNRLSHPSSFPKLESDATIQYALPERINDSTQLDPNYETPYNTYLYDGLPPGAISSPGLDALSAAMFPVAPQTDSGRDIDAYFFVSNDAGRTYYASSKSGHENNVAQVKKDNEAIKNGNYEG